MGDPGIAALDAMGNGGIGAVVVVNHHFAGRQFVVHPVEERLWLVPAGVELAAADYSLTRFKNSTQRLHRAIGDKRDAVDFVLPYAPRQAECMELALQRAGLTADQIDIVSTHATATTSGDIQECDALRRVWSGQAGNTRFNNTKSFIGHAMGAAGALELVDRGLQQHPASVQLLEMKGGLHRQAGQPGDESNGVRPTQRIRAEIFC